MKKRVLHLLSLVMVLCLCPIIPGASGEGTSEPIPESSRQAINAYLTQFSAQRFCEDGLFDHYSTEDVSLAQLIAFACLYADAHCPEALEADGAYGVLDKDVFLDITAPRLAFDPSILPTDGEDYSQRLRIGYSDWERCWYTEGRFYYPMPDQEDLCRFSVAESVSVTGTHVRLEFKVYEAPGEPDGVPLGYDTLTPDQASQLEAQGDITAAARGVALCRLERNDGISPENWLLESYDIYPAN